jgi:hypothetical protein
LIVYIHPPQWGHVAEWLRSGLQNRLHQFNSGRGLHQSLKACHPIKARNPVKALRPIFETGTRLRSRVIVPPDAGRDRAGQTAPDTALMRRSLTENDRFRRRRASSHARKNGRARARPSSHERAARREGAPSAGGVPPIGKRNQRPGRTIVVGCLWPRVGDRQVGRRRVLPGNRRNGRSHNVQQSIELNFTHRDLRLRGEHTVAKFFFFRIELVAQIVTIRRSRPKNGYWILPFSPPASLGTASGGKV